MFEVQSLFVERRDKSRWGPADIEKLLFKYFSGRDLENLIIANDVTYDEFYQWHDAYIQGGRSRLGNITSKDDLRSEDTQVFNLAQAVNKLLNQLERSNA